MIAKDMKNKKQMIQEKNKQTTHIQGQNYNFLFAKQEATMKQQSRYVKKIKLKAIKFKNTIVMKEKTMIRLWTVIPKERSGKNKY